MWKTCLALFVVGCGSPESQCPSKYFALVVGESPLNCEAVDFNVEMAAIIAGAVPNHFADNILFIRDLDCLIELFRCEAHGTTSILDGTITIARTSPVILPHEMRHLKLAIEKRPWDSAWHHGFEVVDDHKILRRVKWEAM
jgi:hypothetical protein